MKASNGLVFRYGENGGGQVETKARPKPGNSRKPQTANTIAPGNAYEGPVSDLFKPRWSYPPRRNVQDYANLFHTSPRLDALALIAQEMANTPLLLYKKSDYRLNGKDAEPLGDHPIYDLLENPMPDHQEMDGFSLMFMTSVYYDLLGEFFWVFERSNGGEILQAYPVPPQWVIFTPYGDFNFFRVLPMGNTSYRQVNIDASDMLWFKNPDMNNIYSRGRGRSEAIGDELESDEYAAKYSKRLFWNDAQPPILITAQGAGPDDVKRLKEEWMQKYGGYKNARSPAFTPWDAKVQKLTDSVREMDFVDSRKYLRDICNQHFSLPPELMGILENSNRSTIDSAYYLFTKNAVMPRIKRLCQIITRQLVAQFDKTLVLAPKNIVPQDESFALQKANTMVLNGTLMADEARALVDIDPLPSSKGQVFVGLPASNRVPLATSDQPKPAPTMPFAPGGPAPAKPQNQTTEEPATPPAAPGAPEPDKTKSVNLRKITKLLGLSTKGSFTTLEKSLHWKMADLGAKSKEAAFVQACDKFSKAKKAAFLKTFNAQVKAGVLPKGAGVAATTVALGSSSDTELLKALTPAWKDALEHGASLGAGILASARKAFHKAGVTVTRDQVSSILTKKLAEFGFEKAESINDTTRDALESSIASGVDADESIDDLRARITNVFDALGEGGYRADAIARTETMGSVNMGQFVQYSAEGVKNKEWLATDDTFTRDAHADDIPDVGMDEPFIVGGEEMQFPGDPNGSAANVVNCRCTILPVLEDDENAQ